MRNVQANFRDSRFAQRTCPRSGCEHAQYKCIVEKRISAHLRAVGWHRVDVASLRLDHRSVHRSKNLPVTGALVDGEIAVLCDIRVHEQPDHCDLCLIRRPWEVIYADVSETMTAPQCGGSFSSVIHYLQGDEGRGAETRNLLDECRTVEIV